MLLMIDNYDSFTYNLVQYFGDLGERVTVCRNDEITIDDVRKIDPEKIVISPGPGRPDSAGISKKLIQTYKGVYPILGVCLGHQCIAEVFGAKIIRAGRIMHGKVSKIMHNDKKMFKGLPNPFDATRYHSLIIDNDTLPPSFQITAQTDQDEIMGISHKDYFIEGIQFHPESILTREGREILKNFLDMVEIFWQSHV